MFTISEFTISEFYCIAPKAIYTVVYNNLWETAPGARAITSYLCYDITDSRNKASFNYSAFMLFPASPGDSDLTSMFVLTSQVL